MVAAHSGKAADVSGASTSSRARLIQWSVHGGLNEQFDFITSGDGYYRIRARHSGLVLQVEGTAGGTDITQRPGAGTAAQQWQVITHASR
ncbi:RICIN domain-containing protein [Actinokineospora sp. 24-640]